MHKKSLIFFSMNSDNLGFSSRAASYTAKIFNRKCKKNDQNKDLDGKMHYQAFPRWQLNYRHGA